MIYLASTSPRRKRLLKSARLVFKCVKPDYVEGGGLRGSPASVAKRHALGKALSAATRLSDGWVLGADTLVYHGGKILGKPANAGHALKMLGLLQGRWHTVYTGVALIKLKEGRAVVTRVFIETTRVKLKKMSAPEIAAYFKKINPLDKAGAYAIQSRHPNIVEKTRGSLSNAIGLPMEKLKKIVRHRFPAR